MNSKQNNLRIAVVDYGAGNIRSVVNALERINIKPLITNNIEDIISAHKVIIPGVGHAAWAMEKLHKHGLVDGLKQLRQPVLGICLGMQLLCRRLYEGNIDGLSIFPVDVLPFDNFRMVVPHMGWNKITPIGAVELIEYAYFVHSYYVPLCDFTIGVTEYGFPFSSVIRRQNFIGVQFHPEKSGNKGEDFLSRFVYENNQSNY